MSNNIYHGEMTVLVRREKELERELEDLRDDFGTWKERVELAENAGRDELAEKARKRIDDLRFEGQKLKHELEEIVKKKKELRLESKRPTGEETRRAQALLKSFKESGLVDPDDAQLEADIEKAAKDDDAALEALKARAEADEQPPSGDVPDEPSPPADDDSDDDLDAELDELRQKMGDADGDDGDVDLDELEQMFSDDD